MSEYLLKVNVDQFGFQFTELQNQGLQRNAGISVAMVKVWAISQLRLYILAHFSEISQNFALLRSLDHQSKALHFSVDSFWSTGPQVSFKMILI